MSFKFSNIDHLRRDRKIEGETGIDLKIAPDIFLVCLAATDANSRWTDKAEKAFAEINRLRNAGYPDTAIDKRFAKLFADAIVIGWHGGIDEDGQPKPGGPKDEEGVPVPFSVQACEEFLTQADDAIEKVLTAVRDTKNFRAERALKIVSDSKN